MGPKLSQKRVMPLPLFFTPFSHSLTILTTLCPPPSAIILQLTISGTPGEQKVPRFLYLRKLEQTKVKGSYYVRGSHVWEPVAIYAFVTELNLHPQKLMVELLPIQMT